MRQSLFALLVLTIFSLFVVLLSACGSEDAEVSDPDGLNELAGQVGYVGESHFGDLSDIRSRGVIRALVTYSRTDFFLDQGQSRGIQRDFLDQFEKQLNAGVSKAENKVHVRYLPVTFDQLIPSLNAGLGDVAAAFLTVTDERKEVVDFIPSPRLSIDEIVVSHEDVDDLSSLDDLAGREVYVLRNSSYAEHLRKLSDEMEERGLDAIKVVEGDSSLLSEDILELVNAGIVPITVVDNYRAELWAKVMPDLRLHEDLAVAQGNKIGWAVRKNSPQLKQELTRFFAKKGKGSLVGNMLFNEYFTNVEWIKDPDKNDDKLEDYLPLFERYGKQYDFDPLALAAQAYQESRLNPKAKSHAGAVGLMQLLPSTAADKNVDIPNISSDENNVHAGTKYMAFLRERYFSDPVIKAVDKKALTLAAYNAGPAKVRKMRALAEKMGLDPNVWSNNVEIAAGRLVGREPVTYVNNIQKYYVAYKLSEQLETIKTRVKDEL